MNPLPINPSLTDALQAYRVLRGRVRHTPLEFSAPLSERIGAPVLVKWENQQLCGSFKIRGALFKMYRLSPEARAQGVVTASSGNHGQGVALAASELGVKATVCVPACCPRTKQDAIRRLGRGWVELRCVAGVYDDAEAEAHRLAEEGRTYVSSFEDPDILCGASTLGTEMLLDEPDLDHLVIPAGGGGLMNGVSLTACALRPGIRIWGVQSEASNPYVVSWADGVVRNVDYGDTLADGLAGYIPQSLLSLAKTRMQGVLEVREREIAEAIAFLHRHHHQVVEGAGAVGVAALLAGKLDPQGGKVGVVISGGNIDEDRILEILRTFGE